MELTASECREKAFDNRLRKIEERIEEEADRGNVQAKVRFPESLSNEIQKTLVESGFDLDESTKEKDKNRNMKRFFVSWG